MYSLTNTELLQGWCEIYWPVCLVQWVIRKYHRNDPNNKHMLILLIFNSFFFLIWIMFHILYYIAETFLASGWISWKKLRTSLPLLKGTYMCFIFTLLSLHPRDCCRKGRFWWQEAGDSYKMPKAMLCEPLAVRIWSWYHVFQQRCYSIYEILSIYLPQRNVPSLRK